MLNPVDCLSVFVTLGGLLFISWLPVHLLLEAISAPSHAAHAQAEATPAQPIVAGGARSQTNTSNIYIYIYIYIYIPIAFGLPATVPRSAFVHE